MRTIAKSRAERTARIEELRKQCQSLSNERVSLEDINEKEDAAPYIGACFKVRNRDSSDRAWWLYIRVLSHDSGNSFNTLQCQIQNGGWHIAVNNEHTYLLPDPKERGLIRITRAQFDAAWRKHVAAVAALNA